MGLPKTLEEWQRVSPAWRERACRMIPEGGYPGSRRRPRDPEEERLLRRLGHTLRIELGAAPDP